MSLCNTCYHQKPSGGCTQYLTTHHAEFCGCWTYYRKENIMAEIPDPVDPIKPSLRNPTEVCRMPCFDCRHFSDTPELIGRMGGADMMSRICKNPKPCKVNFSCDGFESKEMP